MTPSTRPDDDVFEDVLALHVAYGPEDWITAQDARDTLGESEWHKRLLALVSHGLVAHRIDPVAMASVYAVTTRGRAVARRLLTPAP